MKFTVLKIYEDGSRDIRLECGHKLYVGHGITDEYLTNLSFCWDCTEEGE
jgi:hypothetical protein